MVKEILGAVSVICTNTLEKDMEWTAHLNLKMERLNYKFPHSLPLTALFSLSLQMTFSVLVSSCSVTTKTSYFVSKKSFIHLIYNFTTYELYIFLIFDLFYIFLSLFSI